MRAFLVLRLRLSWSGRAAALTPSPLFIFPTPGINFPFSSAATLKWRFGAPLARMLGVRQKGVPSFSRLLRFDGSARPSRELPEQPVQDASNLQPVALLLGKPRQSPHTLSLVTHACRGHDAAITSHQPAMLHCPGINAGASPHVLPEPLDTLRCP